MTFQVINQVSSREKLPLLDAWFRALNGLCVIEQVSFEVGGRLVEVIEQEMRQATARSASFAG